MCRYVLKSRIEDLPSCGHEKKECVFFFVFFLAECLEEDTCTTRKTMILTVLPLHASAVDLNIKTKVPEVKSFSCGCSWF